MTTASDTSHHDGGDHSGGGAQGERLGGSLTDGGSMPGAPDEDRSFGAGRTGAEGEGGGSMSGRGQEDPGEPRGDTHPPAQDGANSPPSAASEGLATSLQPGGTIPGGGPGASQGSLGTGGGSTADSDTGAVARGGR